MKNLAIFFTRKHMWWSLFLIKLWTLRPATLLKRDFKTGVFLWILQNLSEYLFSNNLQMAGSASWSILYKEFVDISYENASFGIQEDSIWLQLICFSTTIAFWNMKYIFRILENCVVFIAQIRHYGTFTALHKLILIALQLTNQIKLKLSA